MVAGISAAVAGLDVLVPFVIKVITLVEANSGKPVASMTLAEMEAALDNLLVKDPQTLIEEGEAMATPGATPPTPPTT